MSAWTARTSPGSKNWFGITSSSDGTKLAACVNPGYIYTSSDTGNTWSAKMTDASRSWSSIAISSTGQYFLNFHVDGGPEVYVYDVTGILRLQYYQIMYVDRQSLP